MTTVLIVYENIPESTDIFLLDVEDADLKWMKKCHRQFINNEVSEDAEEACQKLSVYLEGKPKCGDKGPIDISKAEVLILTGFVM